MEFFIEQKPSHLIYDLVILQASEAIFANCRRI